MRRPDLAPLNERLIGLRDLTVWNTAAGQRLVRFASWLALPFGPHLALLSMLLAAALTFTALTAATAEIYDEVTDDEGIAGLDRPVLNTVLRMRNPLADDLVTAYTHLGGVQLMPMLTAAAVVAMTLTWRCWTPAVLMLVATSGSVAMTVVGKSVVGRVRPPLTDAVPPFESSGSFPSGHALNAIVVAGLLAYLLIRYQRRAWARAATLSAAAAFAFTMGMSRVYLGHHWLTDVLVAWTLGLAWLTVVIVVHRLFLTVSRRKLDSRGDPTRI